MKRPIASSRKIPLVICLLILLMTYSHLAGESGTKAEKNSGSACFLSMLRNNDIDAPIFKVFRGAREIAELREGYQFRFKGTDDEIEILVDFVLRERKCCSFLTYGLVFESDRGGVLLQISGGAGVKELVGMMLPEGMHISPADGGKDN